MIGWEHITLFKYQQIEAYNASADLDDIDKILFSVCAVYDMTEYELDHAGAKKADKLAAKVAKVFASELNPQAEKKIGKYYINYDPPSMTFGQYVELSFFLQHPLRNAHYVMASISNIRFRKNNSADHRRKADYFLHQPVSKIVGSLKLIMERLGAFNKEYSTLFGLDESVTGSAAQSDQFNKRYGWIYSATQIAAHERITLDEVFRLPVRQALNDLAFLKSKGIYEAEQLKMK